MDRYKAPRDKLLCLVNVKTMVENIVGLAAKAGASIGGEWARAGRFGLSAKHARATRGPATQDCRLPRHSCPAMHVCASQTICFLSSLQALTLSFPSSCLWSSAPGCRTWPQTSSERDRAACTLSSSSCLPSRLASISCARKPPWPPASSMPAHLLTWEPAGLPAFPSLCRRYVKRFRARARLSGQFDYMLANLVSAWARACAGWSRLLR